MHATALVGAAHARTTVTFLRHLGGSTAAMLIGMFLFGTTLGVAADLAGSSLESFRLSQPELFMLGMGAAMSATMVMWMRRRGDSGRDCWEMTGAMALPVLAVLASYRAGLISAEPVCPLSCALMIPAMAAAMLFRLENYVPRS